MRSDQYLTTIQQTAISKWHTPPILLITSRKNGFYTHKLVPDSMVWIYSRRLVGSYTVSEQDRAFISISYLPRRSAYSSLGLGGTASLYRRKKLSTVWYKRAHGLHAFYGLETVGQAPIPCALRMVHALFTASWTRRSPGTHRRLSDSRNKLILRAMQSYSTGLIARAPARSSLRRLAS